MSLEDVRTRIAAAEAAAHRAPGSVTLVAVSKVQPAERVEAALVAGQRVFGENRVQEAGERWPPFQVRFEGISLHLVGPLQTNKAKAAVEMFDAIQSLDRPKLAAKLADAMSAAGRSPQIFVQVNTGEEPQKAGVLPAETDAFVASCRREYGFEPAGLMCIPPIDESPSLHFALLAKLAARNGIAGLSMGMSADFEQAIALGATHVRVGSAVFGERTPA